MGIEAYHDIRLSRLDRFQTASGGVRSISQDNVSSRERITSQSFPSRGIGQFHGEKLAGRRVDHDMGSPLGAYGPGTVEYRSVHNPQPQTRRTTTNIAGKGLGKKLLEPNLCFAKPVEQARAGNLGQPLTASPRSDVLQRQI